MMQMMAIRNDIDQTAQYNDDKGMAAELVVH